jgi:hypothetical protein
MHILLTFPFLPMHATYPAYLIVLDLTNLILKPPILSVLVTVKSPTNVSQFWFFPISHSWCTVTRYLTLFTMVKCAQYFITAHIFHTTPCHLHFWYAAEGKRALGRPRCRWEDNIKMDLQEVGRGRGDWMELAQDRDRWRALVGTVRDFQVP